MKALSMSLVAVSLFLTATSLSFAIPCLTQNDHCRNFRDLVISSFQSESSMTDREDSTPLFSTREDLTPVASFNTRETFWSNSWSGWRGRLGNGFLASSRAGNSHPGTDYPGMALPVVTSPESDWSPSLTTQAPANPPATNNGDGALPVPEPGTLLLLGVGLFGLFLFQKTRNGHH